MSYINLPDVHPGRCLNHRKGERCLDYDDVEHVCTFREPVTESFWASQSVYTMPKPEPWVKPGDT